MVSNKPFHIYWDSPEQTPASSIMLILTDWSGKFRTLPEHRPISSAQWKKSYNFAMLRAMLNSINSSLQKGRLQPRLYGQLDKAHRQRLKQVLTPHRLCKLLQWVPMAKVRPHEKSALEHYLQNK